jgi:hypothetical protein
MEAFISKHLDSHGGFNKGDIVRVEGEPKSVFKFLYALLNDDGTLNCYVVVGGLRKRSKMRAFAAERVRIDVKLNKARLKGEKVEIDDVAGDGGSSDGEDD